MASTHIGHQFNIVGNDVTIENCLSVGAIDPGDVHHDTVDLGSFIEGTYTLNVKIRGDYIGPVYCNSYADSVWIDTSFSVLATNSIFEEEKRGVKIYPNPAIEIVHVEHDLEQVKSILICDSSGRIVLSRWVTEFNDDQLTIDLQDLSPGIYFVGVNEFDACSFVQLIVAP